MNKDYKIYGKIISAINNDYPSKVSKKFPDEVMKNIHFHNARSQKKTMKNYLNIAASIFFAVITSYTLINYNGLENSLITPELSESNQTENFLIKKVIDKNSCNDENSLDKKTNVDKKTYNEKCK
tara:strand:+ start:10147 stop:10521 length:375 start_codon:yes stop_codon:yes gene_type:complete